MHAGGPHAAMRPMRTRAGYGSMNAFIARMQARSQSHAPRSSEVRCVHCALKQGAAVPASSTVIHLPASVDMSRMVAGVRAPSVVRCLLPMRAPAAASPCIRTRCLQHRHSRTRGLSIVRLAEYTGPAGQDATELFDVFLPPAPEMLVSRFISIADLDERWTGSTAPRAKCHSEGIWHRSVHV